MCVKGPWAIAVGQEQYPDLEFRYDPIPPYAGTELKFAAESGWGEVVNAKASDEKKAAAWKFIDFMHRDEQPARMEHRPPSPCRRSSRSTTIPPCSRRRPAWQPRSRPSLPASGSAKSATATASSPPFTTPMVSVDIGEASPEDALANAEQEINAMIDENLGP